MLIALSLPPQPGPMPPAPKVLRLGAVGLGFDGRLAAKRAAQEMGATVVVEGEFLAFPTVPADAHWGFLRWRTGANALDPGVLALGAFPMPVWMNPSVVRAGGNVVNQVFTVGGVGF